MLSATNPLARIRWIFMSSKFNFALFAHLTLLATCASAATYLNSFRPFDGPQCFTEPRSKVDVCSEDDGRHLIGRDSGGKALWRRDPFVDAKLEPYRVEFPRIIWIGSPSRECGKVLHYKHCVGISYDSTQFGVVSIKDGSFVFLGQD